MARFVDAYLEINQIENCTALLASLNNETKIDAICEKYPFSTTSSEPSQGIYYFALAHDVGDIATELMAVTDINVTDIGLLYSSTSPLNQAIVATK